MGIRKTYYRAPTHFNHASKIAGHILAFLKESAEKSANTDYSHIVVTVPASFQLNQRRDTLLACQQAGLAIKDEDLLDEPTAALIDYIQTNGLEKVVKLGDKATCVIFDFGGGTCDVSIVEIEADKSSNNITMSQISVSRYHRLGGGDIDAAIVHEQLIPHLLEANNLSPFDLTWAQKKRGLEPQLLGKAEALKIALCKEVERLIKFGRYDQSDKSQIIVKQPPLSCKLGKSEFRLSQPSLSATKFEDLLSPFLDRDFLFAKESEYRLTQSIFAPLEDALDRAEMESYNIDFCLMVGGSSLIPQVRESVEKFFQKGSVGYFEDHLDIQLSVARGAAWNAAIKSLTERPLIEPVLHDGIALITSEGVLNSLIPSRVTLPFPSDGSYAREKLSIPTEFKGRDLRIEVVGEEDKQPIFNEIWSLPEDSSPGDEITMEYRVTSGKQFECRAFLKKHSEYILEKSVENPLVNILNPNELRVKIEEAEEELRNKGGGMARDLEIFIDLAKWYTELGQREKALDYLRTALNKIQRPDPIIIFMQGNIFNELKDYDRADKAYIEADKLMTWDGALFNLALSQHDRKLYDQALASIDAAIEKGGSTGTNLALKALIIESQGNKEEAKDMHKNALNSFDNPEHLDKWEFWWYYDSAKRLGDEKYINKAEQFLTKRRKKGIEITTDDIPRPAIKSDSAKKS